MADWSPLVGLLGVAVGVLLTSYLQGRQRVRAEAATTAEHLRQDRMTAFVDFAGNAMEYRRAQLGYAVVKRAAEDATGTTPQESPQAEDARKTRAALRHAYFRVQLLSADGRLTELANLVEQKASRIHDASTKAEADTLADEVMKDVARFVNEAREQVLAAAGTRPVTPTT